jgi:hypothetical protein
MSSEFIGGDVAAQDRAMGVYPKMGVSPIHAAKRLTLDNKVFGSSIDDKESQVLGYSI